MASYAREQQCNLTAAFSQQASSPPPPVPSLPPLAA